MRDSKGRSRLRRPRLPSARRRPWLVLALGALCLLPAACGSGGDGPPPTTPVVRSSALTPVEGCEALDRYLTDAAVDLFVWQWVHGGVFGGPTPAPGAGGGAGDAGGGDGQPPSTPSEFTNTNVQELGVDEPDLVKTDGEHAYYLQDGLLHVIDAWPAEEARLLAQVELEGHGGVIFLAGDTVVALTSIYEASYPPDPGRPPPGAELGPESEPGDSFTAVRVSMIDVSTPASPAIVHSFDIEGFLVGARMVEGVVYLASQHVPALIDDELLQALAALGLPDPWTLSLEQRRAMADEVAAKARPTLASYVTDRGRAALIPDLRRQDGTRTELLDCTDVLRPPELCEAAMLSVVGFRPEVGARPRGVGLIANGWQVYGSPGSLYVTQDSRWWCWRNEQERRAETHVHQFLLNDGSPVYGASGAVPGWTLSQFSMSEHEGHLRIATTDFTLGGWVFPPADGVGGGGSGGGGVPEPPPMPDDPPGGGVPRGDGGGPMLSLQPPPRDANNVFVLRRDGRELKVVGGVRGIAPDEQIRACRFLGDVGYVVTYEQVDPLFALDLSDPTAPQVMGELHVTGFSSYLHPMDAGQYLIGVGREGDEFGRVQGLQLQLFDVRDLTRPARIHQEVLGTPGGYSGSEAEHDHHAFTFYDAQSLLAIPVTLEDWSTERESYRFFSGAIVYEVSPEAGFSEVGRISHTGFVKEAFCTPETRGDPEVDLACQLWEFPWMARMRRTVFLEDWLFAFSDVGVTVSHVRSLDEPVVEIPLR